MKYKKAKNYTQNKKTANNSALYISLLKQKSKQKIELKIQLLYYCFFVQKYL